MTDTHSHPLPAENKDQRIAELEGDLQECKAGARQAWGICDAVAAALGDDLDREEGSAESVLRLKARLAQAEKKLALAALQARPVRYTYASMVTAPERAYARRTALYKHGDMRLVWVNEGDLFGHTELPMAPDAAPIVEEIPSLPDVLLGTFPARAPQDATALAAEVTRLTKCLAQANSQAEDFERRYYLETHKVDDLHARLAELAAPGARPAGYLIEDKLHTTGIVLVRTPEDSQLARSWGDKAVALYTAQALGLELDPAELEKSATQARVAALREAIGVLEALQVPAGNSAAGEMAAQWTMDSLREVREQLKARIASAPTLASAEWVLVPAEPTPEMLEAAERDRTYYGHVAANHWRAMVKAAPAAPSYAIPRVPHISESARAFANDVLIAAGGQLGQGSSKEEVLAAVRALRERADCNLIADEPTDLSTCPGCGGPADNGFSRDVPPSPYYCTKCHDTGFGTVNS